MVMQVDVNQLKIQNLEVTHINLNDNTVEGMRHKEYTIYTVQYHPEASPGPKEQVIYSIVLFNLDNLLIND